MYELEEKKYFFIITFILIIAIFYFVYYRVRKKKIKNFANESLLNKIAPNFSKVKTTYKFIVWSFIIIFLSLALVNPKLGTKLKTIKRKGSDIVFALDVSKSMLCEDIKPSRFKKAKQLIFSTLNILKGDRVGIIAYAGGAYPLLPITTDYNSARMFLYNTDTDIVPTQGTTIGESIIMASNFFNKKSKKGKLLIMISDGEGHEENLSEQIILAKEQGIKIYTIGIGTNKGGPIPEKRNGNLIGYKKDRERNIVVTKRNEVILKQIAIETKGEYFNGNNYTTKIVDNIEKILDASEKTEFEEKKFSDYKNQFQWFLGIALLLLIFDIFIFERKTLWIEKLNLFKNKK